MLTGDENIVDIDFEVQWKISNAPDFLFNVRNPEETVKAVSESAMREVIGKSQIATVLAEGKLQVEHDTKKLIQDTLNNYKAGIEVVSVNLLKADPPAKCSTPSATCRRRGRSGNGAQPGGSLP